MAKKRPCASLLAMPTPVASVRARRYRGSSTSCAGPARTEGGGETQPPRLVARYADACSLRPGQEIPRKLDVLRRHCEIEGRDYDEIDKTCAFAFDVGEGGEKVEGLVGQLRWLAGMGVETVIGAVPDV